MEKSLFTIYLKKLLLFIFILGSYTISAQENKVTGKVVNENDEPLPGVTIVIKGTTRGTITNMDGDFKIPVNKGETLAISFIGYISQELIVDDQTNISLKLEPDLMGLEEIVVIGYGTVKKEDATGSVTAIKADDFNKGAITTPQELFMGKTAGVVITTNSGEPGAGSQIRIRGGSSLGATNDPLIIIDGFPVDDEKIDGITNAFSTINPNDIETVTVLKDASATAIYGSRASNGVIIITTKKGDLSKRLKVYYNSNVSIGTPVKLHDVLDGDEFRAVVQDRVDNHGLTELALDRLGDANTDWQKEIYQNPVSTDHSLSLAGSILSTPVRASVGYTVQNGLLKYSGIERTTLSVRTTPSLLNDNLKVSVNIKGMDINNNFSNTDAISSAIEFDPTQPITNGNTRYGGYTAWTLSPDTVNSDPINIATHNPVARIEYRDNKSDVIRSIGNIELDYTFPSLPELKANLNTGYDYNKSEGHDYTDEKASWSEREPAQNVKEYEHKVKTSLLDFYLNYVKDMNILSSKIDVTAGYSWQHFYREGKDLNRPWEKTDGTYIGADTIEYKSEYYLVSFFGRLNFSLLDRYIITATLREDGSSRFSKDNRWGLFPSAALAWKLNREAFMSSIEGISELKVRLSWGITGQQNIGSDKYSYLPRYTSSELGAYYQFGNTFYQTLRPEEYDINLRWEETTTYNAGLDFGLFENRIYGSVDVYKRITNDLLNEIPIAAGTNFSNFLITNVGSLENKGIELTFTGRPISTHEMSWEVGVNMSYNKNEITKLTRVNDPDYTGYDTGDEISGGVGNKVLINSIGQPANSFFMFQQVYDTEGDPIEGLYVDKTGEGGEVSGNNANKYYMHNAAPDYLFGISSNFQYKNFDISFAGRLSIGNYVYNNNYSNRALYQNVYNQAGYLSNILASIDDTEFATAQYWSSHYLENASFFRMDNINLGYRFEKLFTEKLTGRVSFTVQNAFVVTAYSGLDPEVDNGIDKNIYPRPRNFILGLNLDF